MNNFSIGSVLKALKAFIAFLIIFQGRPEHGSKQMDERQ